MLRREHPPPYDTPQGRIGVVGEGLCALPFRAVGDARPYDKVGAEL